MLARGFTALAVATLLVAAGGFPERLGAQIPTAVRTSCQSTTTAPAVTQAQAALDKQPDELAPLLKLADALVDQGCYQDAVTVLEAGQAAHPHSGELGRKLRDVRSLVTEQSYIEGLGQAEESAKLQRNLLRCTQLSDVAACDEALRSKPDDVQVMLAKSDALLQKNRAADAIAVLHRAVATSPANETVKGKLAGAEAARRRLLSRCQSESGAVAVEACDGVLVHGAEDEFSIERRKGTLLQSLNQPGPALEAFIAANAIKQGDESVALAIVSLTDSTGRKDALALAARGSSLVTLERLGLATPKNAATHTAQAVRPVAVQAPPPAEIPKSVSAPPVEARVYSNDAPAGHSN